MTKICSICGLDYVGRGNNAQPVNDRLCCDACNEIVIQHRINIGMRRIAERSENGKVANPREGSQ